MSRPIYETNDDHYFENKVKEYFEALGDGVFHKLSMKYGADFLSMSKTDPDTPQALFECKCKRRYRSTDYPYCMISLHKVMTCLLFADAMGIPFYLVVGFADKVVMCRITIIDTPRVRMFGRTNRNDADDIEPCVAIPMARFTMSISDQPEDYFLPIPQRDVL